MRLRHKSDDPLTSLSYREIISVDYYIVTAIKCNEYYMRIYTLRIWNIVECPTRSKHGTNICVSSIQTEYRPQSIGFPWFIHVRINIQNEGLSGDDTVPVLCILRQPVIIQNDTSRRRRKTQITNEIRFTFTETLDESDVILAKHSQVYLCS